MRKAFSFSFSTEESHEPPFDDDHHEREDRQHLAPYLPDVRPGDLYGYRSMCIYWLQDYVLLFLNAVRNKTQTPVDVYDSVLMSVICPLSEKSIAEGGSTVECPDFTRGKWSERRAGVCP